VEESFWKRLWTCRVSDRLLMNESLFLIPAVLFASLPLSVLFVHFTSLDIFLIRFLSDFYSLF
jgi:hypothetical protein